MLIVENVQYKIDCRKEIIIVNIFFPSMCISYLLKQWCYVRKHPKSQWFKTEIFNLANFSSGQLSVAALDRAEMDSIIRSWKWGWP